MSRLYEREAAIARRASAGTLPAETTGIDTLFGLAGRLARFLRRRRTIAELNRLDDRLLADIGLSRGDIPSVARSLAARVGAAPRRSREVGLLAWLRQARKRRAMIAELEHLPDRILNDIGLQRGQIEETVERLLAAQDGAAGTESREPAGSARPHGLADRIESGVRPLRQWQLSRVAAGQLARLSPGTLADLGYVKGDLDWVPEVLAERRLGAAANSDELRRGAA